MGIIIHAEKDFEGMRSAGRLAATILDFITKHVKPGVSTGELNDLCHKEIVGAGAVPAPLNYKGFPKSVCTSVNQVVCHGIPDYSKILKDGDIINIDVTVILDGWHGDTSRMYWVGEPPEKAKKLCADTHKAMMLGIAQVKPGNTVGDIGHAIQSFAEGERGYSVVRDYCGHGLGKVFHTEPSIFHYGSAKMGIQLKPGMFFTVEPMINLGKSQTKLNPHDGWTVTTKDRSLSAQFEHSLGVTEEGPEIFTLSPKGYACPPYEIVIED
ncbi:methionine aminopeptidase [Rickettsiales bacterium]|nr:methionine aminopeptidase [Rickettsiales bacterium]